MSCPISDTIARRAPDERRARIIEAADDLFVEQGYDDTSIAQVAAHAGVAVGTVYLSFPDKPSLKIGVVNHRKRALAELIDRHSSERGKTREETFARVIGPVLAAMLRAPQIVSPMDRERLEALGPDAVAAFAAVDDAIVRYLSALQADGLIGEFDEKTAPLLMSGLATSAAECVRRGQASLEAMVAELARVMGLWLCPQTRD